MKVSHCCQKHVCGLKRYPYFPGFVAHTHAQCTGPVGKPGLQQGRQRRCRTPRAPRATHSPLQSGPFLGFAALSGGGLSLTPCPSPTCLSASRVARSVAYKPLPFSTSHRRGNKALRGMERSAKKLGKGGGEPACSGWRRGCPHGPGARLETRGCRLCQDGMFLPSPGA